MAQRAMSAGSFALLINGVAQGYCKSVKGAGKVTVDVAETKISYDYMTMKAASNFKVGEVTAEIGVGMGKSLYEWIKKSFDYAHTYQDCSVLIGDADYNAKREIVLGQALITKVTTPKMDATGKESGFFTIGATPETLRYIPGKGKVSATTGAKQKMWMTHNFRLDITGLDCSTVTSVDPFEWSQQTVVNAYGHLKENELLATGLKCGDLKFSFSAGPDGKQENAMSEWVHSWVVNGKQTSGDHLSGTLTYLAQDMKTELGSITFDGLGLKEYSPPDLSREDKARVGTMSMYCEHALLQLKETDA